MELDITRKLNCSDIMFPHVSHIINNRNLLMQKGWFVICVILSVIDLLSKTVLQNKNYAFLPTFNYLAAIFMLGEVTLFNLILSIGA